MHPTAYKNAEDFHNEFVKCDNPDLIVLDFGSYDVNGTMKPIFRAYNYMGLDMCEGPNVNLVCNCSKVPLGNNYADVIISSSCFEHDECFWETFLEMCRLVKPGGYIYINAPSAGWYHGFPGDCWRFFADSWKALEKYANRKGFTMELVKTYIDQNCAWKNSVGIYKKL